MAAMTTTLTTETAEAVAATVDYGQPSARKTGRNPRWPYVPVLLHGHQQSQIMGKAFATRDEAIEYAASHVERLRSSLAAKLVDPRQRALREYHGLPREIAR